VDTHLPAAGTARADPNRWDQMALDMHDRDVECGFGRGRDCQIFAEDFVRIGAEGTR